MRCRNLGQRHQRLTHRSHARERVQRNFKTRRTDQVAGQRQVGNAQGFAVAAGGAFGQQCFVGGQAFAEPVRGPVDGGRLAGTEALGQLRPHPWHHQRVRVCRREQKHRPHPCPAGCIGRQQGGGRIGLVQPLDDGQALGQWLCCAAFQRRHRSGRVDRAKTGRILITPGEVVGSFFERHTFGVQCDAHAVGGEG